MDQTLADLDNIVAELGKLTATTEVLHVTDLVQGLRDKLTPTETPEVSPEVVEAPEETPVVEVAPVEETPVTTETVDTTTQA